MKRVLLTGCGGFVGAHTLIHILHNTDWHVVGIDSFRHRGNQARITEVLHKSHPEYLPRVTIITSDLTVPISKQTAHEIGKIDYIVHMASLSHVDVSIKRPRWFIENNINLHLTVLEYAKKYPVEKIIHVSTDEVYGPAPEDHDHTEGEPHRPSNAYSASKACQEDISYSYWRTENLPIIQTNTMNLFGEFQDPEKLIPKTMQCMQNDTVMPIYANNDKTAAGTRKYLHARNQADALIFILNNVKPTSYQNGDSDIERINVVGDVEISNLDMALLIARFYGKELKYEMVSWHESRPGHDLRYSLNGEKLKKLGWKAPLSFESSLKETVEWTKLNPDWIL